LDLEVLVADEFEPDGTGTGASVLAVSGPVGIYDDILSWYDSCVFDAVPAIIPEVPILGVYDDELCMYDGVMFDEAPPVVPPEGTVFSTAVYGDPESVYKGAYYNHAPAIEVPVEPFPNAVYGQPLSVYQGSHYNVAPTGPVEPPVPVIPDDGRWLIWNVDHWAPADYRMPVYIEALNRFIYIPATYVWITDGLTSSTDVGVFTPASYTGDGLPLYPVPDPEIATFDVSLYDESIYSTYVNQNEAVHDLSKYDESVYKLPPPIPGSATPAVFDDTNSTYDVSLFGTPVDVPGSQTGIVYDDAASQYDYGLYFAPPIPPALPIAVHDAFDALYNGSWYARKPDVLPQSSESGEIESDDI
jgi:hypothetical protein